MSNPVIVNTLTNEIKAFKDVKEITIGRNATSLIDIPSPYISRTQCILKLTENNEWSLTDLSRHHTTQLNSMSLQGNSPVLRSGDKITFLYYKDGEYTFYNSLSDVPNPSKKRKLESHPEFTTDVLTPLPVEPDLKSRDQLLIQSQSNVILELNRELGLLKEKYDSALEEIHSQRRVNENISHKLNIVLTESSDTVNSLQKENELLNNKLKEEEAAKEKMINEIQELNELLKESELEQIRLTDECKCKELGSNKNSTQDDEPKSPKEQIDIGDTVTTSEALQKLVEIVEIKWNEQEMEHMREELKKRDERITDITLETERFQNQVVETLDREMLCSICNDIIYEATTLNCRHTFCKVCLVEWKKKKKECPVCRAKIKTETRPLVIDSFIDKLSDTIGGELKTRRAEVKEERTVKRGASTCPSRTTPYNRNNRRTRGNFNTISSAMSILQPLVIELSDHFHPGEIVPAPVIDLTESPTTPRQRRRRQINSYYIV